MGAGAGPEYMPTREDLELGVCSGTPCATIPCWKALGLKLPLLQEKKEKPAESHDLFTLCQCPTHSLGRIKLSR
jgi:hypothetical protein